MRWRTGRKVGRTIYVDDRLVGVMDTPALARTVVWSVRWVRRAAVVVVGYLLLWVGANIIGTVVLWKDET